MNDNSDKLNQLLEKIEALSKRQESFFMEINQLRKEINLLKPTSTPPKSEAAPAQQKEAATSKVTSGFHHSPGIAVEKEKAAAEMSPGMPPISSPKKAKTDLEKFIGENLISKIGIVITVIGLAIGVKYSIDHNLINPLTRIILGYGASLALLLTGIRLKKNYESYSAVLVSGAMASFYFITYAAYSFYALVPQTAAFVMMLLYTAFTVYTAIHYNRQVIAIIGMAGAYAIPLLLSDGSGRVQILFSYMAVINAGIALLSIKKYWKAVYLVSFGLTWFIYLSWSVFNYEYNRYFTTAFFFSSIFFLTFYIIFLAYKLIRQEKFNRGDIVLLLLNSLIYYSIGYSLIDSYDDGDQFLGLFTLANAVIHFIACSIIYRKKLADRRLFYLVAGLVLVFITLAIPVQLNGHWVTILWAAEAALLFWIGRTKNAAVYEQLSYPLMFLALISMIADWSLIDIYDKDFRPFVNNIFLGSALFCTAFGFISYIQYRYPAESKKGKTGLWQNISEYLIPGVLILSLYFSFSTQISAYFDNKYYLLTNSGQYNPRAENMLSFKNLWLINYTILFLSAMILINIFRLQKKNLALLSLILAVIVLAVFLTVGSNDLNSLRNYYFASHSNGFLIGIRYICYGFVVLLLFSVYKQLRINLAGTDQGLNNLLFDLVLHISLLVVGSNELVTWLQAGGFASSDKLGLSILWGMYSLLLIVSGIIKRKKHLRLAAIVLFGITLVKLFFYDLQGLNTVSKTIVFISLGVLLLIISFLYNKFKNVLFPDDEK